MTRASRDLSVTTDTPQGYKSTAQYGGSSDNFDSASPSRLAFFIDEEAIILDAKLRVDISAYRTWETDVASAGSSAPTSGASSASTTVSAGSSAPTSSGGGSHKHLMFNAISGTPLGAGTERRYFAKAGSDPSLDLETAIRSSGFEHLLTYDTATSHTHTVTIGGHTHGMAHTHTVTIAGHTHPQVYSVVELPGLPGAMSIAVDGVNVDSIVGAPWTASSLPAVFEASLTGVLTQPGWHTVTLSTASGRARATMYAIVKSLQL